jgi:uncharacterized protein
VLSQQLLDILVCPLGKEKLLYENDKLICTRCGVKFSVENDIPIMLIEEAELPAGISSYQELPCMKKEA